MTHTYDAIIIGTGQAGPYLASRLTAAGQTVAIVERKLFGGTCINTGCIPTKTMVASAQAAQLARRAAEFGVDIAGGAAAVRVDMARVKARKDAIVRKYRESGEGWLRKMKGCTVYEGQGRFESSTTVRVEPGGALLTAERIFVNVGGRASVPPDMPGVNEVPFFTNSTLLDIDFVPEHLIVVGGSYIGLEFGQMFRRFGSEVTILEMGPRLIGREDPDVSDRVRQIVEAEGINVRLNAKCIGFANGRATSGGHASSPGPDAILAHVDCTEGAPEVRGSHLLLAVGRTLNTSDLGLEHTGATLGPRGEILVDESLRTDDPHIWAMGDCNGRGAFTHTAFNDAEIVVANLLDREPRRVSDRIPAYALYIDPPLGRAGLTEAEARKSGRRLLVCRREMTAVKRAVIKGESQGFMKALVDADTREILGAVVLGPEGDEIIHSLLDVMYAKAPYMVVERAMHIHPTVSELIPTMLQDLKPLD